MFSKLFWLLKQLFPLTYRTHYASDGKRHFAVWKMFMGRCYRVDDVVFA